MKKYKIVGYANHIGSFMTVGIDHSYNSKDCTLIVSLEDGGKKIFTEIISFTSTPIPETDAEKVVRLEKEIVELEKH